MNKNTNSKSFIFAISYLVSAIGVSVYALYSVQSISQRNQNPEYILIISVFVLSAYLGFILAQLIKARVKKSTKHALLTVAAKRK